MKVLIIQQKMIGDVLTSSILFEALRTKYPNAELHYLINSHTYPVVEHNSFIDQFIFFTPEIEQNKTKLLQFAIAIRKTHYDIIIDAYSKLSSNIITLFSGAKIKVSKYKSYSSFIYHHAISYYNTPKTKAGLAIENRLQLLGPLNIVNDKIFKPKIYLTDVEIKASKDFLIQANINLSQPLFMISVLGSGKSKTYPLPYMAKVIDSIVAKTKGQILFNYIPNQESDAKLVYDLCKEETKEHIFFNVFGKNLRDFIAITHHCDALIGNEGGAVNMAKALNIPTFTIFSPWIDKATWNTFEEDTKNVSVHLKDFKPELYKNASEKEMKPKAMKLYDDFLPDFFYDKLSLFLKQING